MRTDGDWFDIMANDFPAVVTPSSVPAERIPGFGHHRIKVPDGEISFADEMPGIQVTFEEYTGTYDQALAIVKEVLSRIQQATGQRGSIVALEGESPAAVFSPPIDLGKDGWPG